MTSYCVYVLLSERDNNFYVGFSRDVNKRLNEHNKGLVSCTKSRVPFKLVHIEAFTNRKEVVKREKYLKGKGGIRFKKLLKDNLTQE